MFGHLYRVKKSGKITFLYWLNKKYKFEEEKICTTHVTTKKLDYDGGGCRSGHCRQICFMRGDIPLKNWVIQAHKAMTIGALYVHPQR